MYNAFLRVSATSDEVRHLYLDLIRNDNDDDEMLRTYLMLAIFVQRSMARNGAWRGCGRSHGYQLVYIITVIGEYFIQ